MTSTGVIFVQMASLVIPSGPVLEVGSRIVHTQEHMALRPLFPGREYVGVDTQEGNGVDMVGDGAAVDKVLTSRRFSLGICMDTLEHCRHPEKVLRAMAKLCDALCVRAPFCFPLHDHPSDYWRFTPALLAEILRSLYPSGFAGQDNAQATWPGYGEHLLPMHAYGFGAKDGKAVSAMAQRFQGRGEFAVVRDW